jgi:aconitate hydratase
MRITTGPKGCGHAAARQIDYSECIEFDLGSVVPSVAGPKRPQDRIELPKLEEEFIAAFSRPLTENGFGKAPIELDTVVRVSSGQYAREMDHSYGIAKPPSARAKARCGSTPHAARAAGTAALGFPAIRGGNPPRLGAHRGDHQLHEHVQPRRDARRRSAGAQAVERGLRVNPVVKTSLAPGSRVVTDYLRTTGLQPYLDQLGFNLVGYGCTTCIGNSGPLRRRWRKPW